MLAPVIDHTFQACPRFYPLIATKRIDVPTHVRILLQSGRAAVQINIPTHRSCDIYVRAKSEDIAPHLAFHI
jgi:hypothetical protein